MPAIITISDEPTRRVILCALWEHLAKADGKVDGFSDGLYDLVSDGFRPEATEDDYQAARARFDAFVAFLSNNRADVERVEAAELRAAVTLKAITKEELVEELDSYRRWIRDNDEEFWRCEHRQDILDKHDAITALLAEFGEPAVA